MDDALIDADVEKASTRAAVDSRDATICNFMVSKDWTLRYVDKDLWPSSSQLVGKCSQQVSIST